MPKSIAIFFGVVIVSILLFSSCTVISPGNAGVVFNKLSGSLRTAPQGLLFRIPFFTSVQSYPVALRTYTMVKRDGEGSGPGDDAMDLPSKEGQHIRQDISVTYNTDESKAADVFRSFRGQDIQDIEESFIRRTIITVAQNAAGQMSLTELISDKRSELASAIESHLKVELAKMGFMLDKVNLGASHLPQVIEKQMQEKMAAQQEASRAQFELIKNQTLAQARVAEAKGQAEANKLLQQTITPELIRLKSVEKWDGHLPHVVGGATPMIDLKGAM